MVRGRAACGFKSAGLLRDPHSCVFTTVTATAFGDFRGLTEKLDYLQWLGIDCILAAAVSMSHPSRTAGYDISDFYKVHHDYGTVEDVRQLIDAAHARPHPRPSPTS